MGWDKWEKMWLTCRQGDNWGNSLQALSDKVKFSNKVHHLTWQRDCPLTHGSQTLLCVRVTRRCVGTSYITGKHPSFVGQISWGHVRTDPSRHSAHHHHCHPPPCKASVLLRESLRLLRCPWRRHVCVLRWGGGVSEEKLDLIHQKWKRRASLITYSKGFSLQIPFRPPHRTHPSGLLVLLNLPASPPPPWPFYPRPYATFTCQRSVFFLCEMGLKTSGPCNLNNNPSPALGHIGSYSEKNEFDMSRSRCCLLKPHRPTAHIF